MTNTVSDRDVSGGYNSTANTPDASALVRENKGETKTNMIGYEQEIREIGRYRDMLLNAAEYKKLGLYVPKGLVIFGPQGVGKSTLAKELCTDGINTTTVNIDECSPDDVPEIILNSIVKAKENMPHVVILDGIDKAFGDSGSLFGVGNCELQDLLITQFDSLKPSDQVFIVATCQDAKWASGALMERGRFEKGMFMAPPDETTRRRMLKECLAKVHMRKSIPVDEAARMTRGFCAGDIKRLVNEMGLHAVTTGKDVITFDDFTWVIDSQVLGNETPAKLCDEERHQIAVHEAGHAVVAMTLAPDSLYGASIIPKGDSLGHVKCIGEENRTVSIAELENDVTIMLGGHVAERMILGEYLTGASSDISGAGKIIYDLVTKEAAYGYDYVLLNAGKRMDELNFDGVRNQAAHIVSEKLAELDSRAERIISANRALYESIVRALEKNSTLSRKELLEMKGSQCELMAA